MDRLEGESVSAQAAHVMRLDPQLLQACAAYLAHERAYGLSALAPLRGDARNSMTGAWTTHAPDHLVGDDDTHASAATALHLGAIRSWGSRRGTGGVPVGAEAVAKAILEATPHMLAWWCATLGAEALPKGDSDG